MEECYYCECGCPTFDFYGCFVRCSACRNEFKHTGSKGKREYWMRRCNLETFEYHNWEHVSDTAFKEPESNHRVEQEMVK